MLLTHLFYHSKPDLPQLKTFASLHYAVSRRWEFERSISSFHRNKAGDMKCGLPKGNARSWALERTWTNSHRQNRRSVKNGSVVHSPLSFWLFSRQQRSLHLCLVPPAEGKLNLALYLFPLERRASNTARLPNVINYIRSNDGECRMLIRVCWLFLMKSGEVRTIWFKTFGETFSVSSRKKGQEMDVSSQGKKSRRFQ